MTSSAFPEFSGVSNIDTVIVIIDIIIVMLIKYKVEKDIKNNLSDKQEKSKQMR